MCNKFINFIRPDYVPHFNEVNNTKIKPTNCLLEVAFTFQELKYALKSKKKDTSTGSDGKTYSMIRYLPDNALKIILNNYNNIWNYLFNIPQAWKHFRIIALLKPLKDSHLESLYRPISLISGFIKIFNTMIKNRLEWLTEKHNIVQ